MNAKFKHKSALAEASAEELKPKVPYMKQIIVASRVINMWPLTTNRNSFFYHLFVWVIIINNVLFVSAFCIQIKTDFENMDSVTALIDFVTALISGTFRYIYIYIRRNKYLHLVSFIHNDFINCPIFRSKRKVSLKKYYRLVNRLSWTYGVFTLLWILQICFTPLISYVWANLHLSLGFNETEPEHIPYPVAMKVYAPFDYQKQPANILFYIYQSLGFLLFGYIYIVVDCFWYLIIFLTIGQLDLINDSLCTLAEYLREDETAQDIQLSEKDQVNEVEAGLKKIIEHHQFIRKFILLIEEINSPNVLVDSLHAVISIGFILLDVTIALNRRDFNKITSSLGYLTTSIVHMFFFDWLANELTEKEQKLAEAAYEIPWYKCPSQKAYLSLLMIQSRRPCRLTGGKMYQLSLGFFASMLRAVFSYFTFLLQLRNKTPKPMK